MLTSCRTLTYTQIQRSPDCANLRSDRILLVMTSEGGNYGAGTLFRITTTGVFTVLRHFNYDTDGGVPDGTLIIQK